MTDRPVKSASLEYFDETNTITLTMECRDEATAERMYAEIARGLKNGTLKISAGEPAAVEERGGLQ